MDSAIRCNVQCAFKIGDARCSQRCQSRVLSKPPLMPRDLCTIIGRPGGITGLLCSTHCQIDRCSLRFKCKGTYADFGEGRNPMFGNNKNKMQLLTPEHCQVAGKSIAMAGVCDQLMAKVSPSAHVTLFIIVRLMLHHACMPWSEWQFACVCRVRQEFARSARRRASWRCSDSEVALHMHATA